MPTPTKAELWDQLTKYVKIPDQLWKFGADNATNYLGMEDAVRQALEGDHASVLASDLDTVRSSLSNLYSGRKSPLDRIFEELARVGYSISTRGLSTRQIIQEVATEMNSASETIASREITFGSVSAGGSNVSTGNIYRVTQDRFGNDIESGAVGTVKLEVTRDQNQGVAPGAEEIRIYGSGVTKADEIDLGTAPSEVVNTTFINGNSNLLRNPSFESLKTTLTEKEQTGWTLDDETNFSVVDQTGDIFRFQPGTEGRTPNPVGKSLQFDDNGWFAQYFTRERLRADEDPDVPFILVLRYMRKNSADGTLQLRLGSQTTSVVMTSATNDVWADLVIGNGSTNKGYFDNFKENWVDTTGTPVKPLGVRVRVDLTGRTTGEVICDALVLAKGVKFNGLYYFPVSGSNTSDPSGDAQKDDFWTFADSYTTGGTAQGRTQEVIRRLYGQHLPHTSGVETYSDA